MGVREDSLLDWDEIEVNAPPVPAPRKFGVELLFCVLTSTESREFKSYKNSI